MGRWRTLGQLVPPPEGGVYEDDVTGAHDAMPPFMSAQGAEFGTPAGVETPAGGVAGDLLLFPSWMPHRVSPSEGDAPRISVSFNLEGPWGALPRQRLSLGARAGARHSELSGSAEPAEARHLTRTVARCADATQK